MSPFKWRVTSNIVEIPFKIFVFYFEHFQTELETEFEKVRIEAREKLEEERERWEEEKAKWEEEREKWEEERETWEEEFQGLEREREMDKLNYELR